MRQQMLLPNGTLIRLASAGDRKSILPLMLSFKEESSYKGPSVEEDILDTIDTYISKSISKPKEVLVIVAIEATDERSEEVSTSVSNNSILGIIVGTASKLPFNKQIQACETVWYVSPEHRNTEIGLALYKAFEYWAVNRAGAEVIYTASPAGSKLGKMFTKEGYTPLEEVFIKELS